MLQSPSSLQFVSTHFEGGELWLCEPDMAFSAENDL